MEFGIPVGSTAEILLPACNEDFIMLDGNKISAATTGILSVEKNNENLKIMVQSGTYSFNILID